MIATELACLSQDAFNTAVRRVVEAGQAMRGLLQSLASSISEGTPSLLPKGRMLPGRLRTDQASHYKQSLRSARICMQQAPVVRL